MTALDYRTIMTFRTVRLKPKEEAKLRLMVSRSCLVERLFVPYDLSKSLLITSILMSSEDYLASGPVPATMFADLSPDDLTHVPQLMARLKPGHIISVGVKNNHEATLARWKKALVWVYERTGISLFGASHFGELKVSGLMVVMRD